MTKTYRLIFLGAGFSQPAGLPLGHKLFQAVRDSLQEEHGRNNSVERDLAKYIQYMHACGAGEQKAETIDYETFLSYLDVEHYLRLDGGDTWSDEGNVSQLMVRRAIAKVLLERTPKEPPALYRQFVRRLNPSDKIFTFNYDTLLENALEAERIPYRLFPYRFSEEGWTGNTVDSSKKEVVLLKLHGSIDWFDRAVYEQQVSDEKQCPVQYQVKHPVFGDDRIVTPLPLTDGLRSANDSLAKLYRVCDTNPLLARGFRGCCPLILSPSHTKLFYVQPLRDFWQALGSQGLANMSLAVVGYSLPSYDSYVRQVFYRVFSNYTNVPDMVIEARRKTNIRILDYGPNDSSGTAIRTRYQFMDWGRTDLRLDGFTEKNLDWLLG